MKKILRFSEYLQKQTAVHRAFLAILLFTIYYLLLFVPFANAASLIPDRVKECGKTGNCHFFDLVAMGNSIINFLIYYIASPMAVLLFMWAGFIFMFKSDNPGEISKAKGMFWNVVVGFVLALAGFIVIKLILLGLGAQENLYQDYLSG